MFAIRTEAVALDLCSYCQGTWVEGKELGAWLNARGRGLGKLARALQANRAGPAVDAGMKCPGCNSALHVRKLGHLEFDKCEECAGVFFDWRAFERAIEQSRETRRSVNASPTRKARSESGNGYLVLEGIAELIVAIGSASS